MKIFENRMLNLLGAILFGVFGLMFLVLNCMLFVSYNTIYWVFIGLCPLSFIAAFMFGDNAKSLKKGTGIKWG